MSLIRDEAVAVVGGGPVGALFAAFVARRGCDVDLYEQRGDMRRADGPAGRSINLVLTARGLRALDLLGAKQEVLALTMPVTGRMTHTRGGERTFLRYGKDDSECNYSVSRAELNKLLLTKAEEAGARVHFGARLVDADVRRRQLVFDRRGDRFVVDANRVFGCDGAPSALRKALVAHSGVDEHEALLDYGYKELLFAQGADGGFAMEKHALHIWARGGHMLMGLPNLDGSFTGTIYMPLEGADSFAALDAAPTIEAFFAEHYASATPHIDDLAASFTANPTGILGTVRCHPWCADDFALLLGDAAHAIVPFFGQGLNAGFEDCAVLARLFDEADDVAAAFATFSSGRKPDTDAIADMALENFVEMRDTVRDPGFVLRKRLETRIEQAFPALYRSRYAMVMYSTIPYHLAQAVGEIQRRLLVELTKGVDDAEQVDLDVARARIEAQLSPFIREHRIDLTFSATTNL